MKRFLYIIALMLLLVSAYFVYQWIVSEPHNREPLPAFLTLLSTLVLTFIAWRTESDYKGRVNVRKVKNSTVDVDEKEGTDYDISNIVGKSKVLINKGKKSLKSRD